MIILLGLTPLLWYKPGYIIGGGDTFPFVEPALNLPRASYIWLDTAPLGSVPLPGGFSPSQFIWYSLWYILASTGLAFGLVQILFEVFYFLGSGLSIYFLARTLYPKQKLTPFIASIFFMFNFIMIFRVLNAGASWFLIFMPFLIAFFVRFVRNLRNDKSPYGNILGFAFISSVLLSFASVNAALVVLVLTVCFAMFIYSIFSHKEIRFKLIKSLIILSALCFLINLWWIVPFSSQLLPYLSGSSQLGTVTDAKNWLFVFDRSSFLNLFSLNAVWSWTNEYVPYINLYSNPLLILMLYIPVMLAFTGLLLKNERKKQNLHLAIIALVLFFLAKGLHPPLESVNALLYSYLPGFFLFRDPFMKFGLLLLIILALLVGTSANAIAERITRIRFHGTAFFSKLFVVLLVTSFLVPSFPMFTGQIIPSRSGDTFSPYIKIPDYWYSAAEYLNNQPGSFRVLLMPNDDYYQMPYKWGYYGTDSLASQLIAHPVVYQTSGAYAGSSDLISSIYSKVALNQTEGFVTLLSLLNIEFILQRNDVMWNMTGRYITSPLAVRSFLNDASGIILVASFGELDIYKVINEQNEKIYSASKIISINGGLSDLSKIISDDIQLINGTCFFLSEGVTPEKSDLILRQADAFFNKSHFTVVIGNEATNPFSWDALSEGDIEIRTVNGWKTIIRTDGNETSDTLSFPSIKQCPYNFSAAYNASSWAALNSTIVYLRTGETPLTIARLLENGYPVNDVLGVWWETGWEGMITRPILYPVTIPPNQRAIIQINHIIAGNISFEDVARLSYGNLSSTSTIDAAQVSFEPINPTMYTVKITNATNPFFLIFGEKFDSQWKVYISNEKINSNQTLNTSSSKSNLQFSVGDILCLYRQQLDEQCHFMVNGYANSWYIDPQALGIANSDFTVTLYYLPQSYLCIALLVSGISATFSLAFIFYYYRERFQFKQFLNKLYKKR